MQISTLMTIVALIIVAALAIRSTVKHFKGQGGCCGGGEEIASAPEPAKLLEGPVIARKQLTITGMHCEHCAERVTRALQQIEGVSAVVDYKAGTAVVSMDREVSDELLMNAVRLQDYGVEGITDLGV